MSTLKKQYRRIALEYKQLHKTQYIDLQEVAAWAIRTKRWEPQTSSLIQQCKELLGRALREETFTDSHGNRVRANHVIVTENNGKQTSIWAHIGTANRKHMALSFQQRRKQLVGGCCRLKTDVNYFNETRTEETPIQLVLDFSRDVDEAALATLKGTPSTVQPRRPSRQPRISVPELDSPVAPSQP